MNIPKQASNGLCTNMANINYTHQPTQNLILSNTDHTSRPPHSPKQTPLLPNMATLHISPTSSPFTIYNSTKTNLSPFHPKPLSLNPKRLKSATIRSYKVVIEHQGETRTLEVDPDENILSRALDVGLSVPHDCRLGVCMTCPAKLVSGTVDQSEGMLSDDVVDRGYALLCAAYPRSDCHIQTIPEEELLALQLATAND